MELFVDMIEKLGHLPIEKRAITNHKALNEAYD